jgi:hypothetical protein
MWKLLILRSIDFEISFNATRQQNPKISKSRNQNEIADLRSIECTFGSGRKINQAKIIVFKSPAGFNLNSPGCNPGINK